jgi:L-alanine-DL-glutamate epimerase-like enolase superfamily enzyme
VRIDANEGWTREEALEKMRWLERQNVEFVEQPLPAADLDGVRWLAGRTSLPMFADESVHVALDIPKLAGVFHGINIKLMKCGGVREALRMIHTARACGMKIMLGCMIESSVGITAAAHLTPLVDYADLDGNILIRNDPAAGVTVRRGKLVLPEGPGLGVTIGEGAVLNALRRA